MSSVCGRLRDQTLPQLGVQLEDRPDGTTICKLMSAAEQADVRYCALTLSSERIVPVSRNSYWLQARAFLRICACALACDFRNRSCMANRVLLGV